MRHMNHKQSMSDLARDLQRCVDEIEWALKAFKHYEAGNDNRARCYYALKRARNNSLVTLEKMKEKP